MAAEMDWDKTVGAAEDVRRIFEHIPAAATLDRQIAVESRSGIAPVTIDLSAVTHLGSAGVGALAAACDRARKQGTECVLVAPPGSPAHHVLSLVQLPVVGADTEDIFAQE